MYPRGVSYISNIAGFKDTHYGFGGFTSGTLISGSGREARIQKELLKKTKTEEDKFSLALYNQTMRYPYLDRYKQDLLTYSKFFPKLRFKNPLALLMAFSILKFEKGAFSIDEKKFGIMFEESDKEQQEEENEEGQITVTRKKNGIRDVDIIKYAIFLIKNINKR